MIRKLLFVVVIGLIFRPGIAFAETAWVREQNVSQSAESNNRDFLNNPEMNLSGSGPGNLRQPEGLRLRLYFGGPRGSNALIRYNDMLLRAIWDQ